MQDHDSILIAAIRNGDPQAWNDLIARYERRLFAFSQSRLRDPAAAEDVVQETFLGFLRSLPNYDHRTPLESYLFSIAAHKITDLMRQNGRRPRLLDGDADSPTERLVSSQRKVSSLMRSVERRQRESEIIAETLSQLIEHWIAREEFERFKCLELLWVRGWPNKKVAGQLGISEQQVANYKQGVVIHLKETIRRKLKQPILPRELGLSEE